MDAIFEHQHPRKYVQLFFSVTQDYYELPRFHVKTASPPAVPMVIEFSTEANFQNLDNYRDCSSQYTRMENIRPKQVHGYWFNRVSIE